MNILMYVEFFKSHIVIAELLSSIYQ